MSSFPAARRARTWPCRRAATLWRRATDRSRPAPPPSSATRHRRWPKSSSTPGYCGSGRRRRRAVRRYPMPSSPSARWRRVRGRRDAPIGQPLVAFKGSDGVAILPAGRYLVRVEQGLARADRSVVVPVGSQGVLDVPLNAARLQLSAAGKEVAESAEVAHLQHCRGRPRCPERSARGGAVGGAAGRLRAGAGDLLRDRAAWHDRGAREPRRRAPVTW